MVPIGIERFIPSASALEQEALLRAEFLAGTLTNKVKGGGVTELLLFEWSGFAKYCNEKLNQVLNQQGTVVEKCTTVGWHFIVHSSFLQSVKNWVTEKPNRALLERKCDECLTASLLQDGVPRFLPPVVQQQWSTDPKDAEQTAFRKLFWTKVIITIDLIKASKLTIGKFTPWTERKLRETVIAADSKLQQAALATLAQVSTERKFIVTAQDLMASSIWAFYAADPDFRSKEPFAMI